MQGKIVAATDGSDCGTRAVDLAAELSNRMARDLCIVHVQLHGRPSEELAHLAEAEHLVQHLSDSDLFRHRHMPAILGQFIFSLEEEADRAWTISAVGDWITRTAATRARDAGAQNVTTKLRSGDHADEILDVASAEGAGMIVIGRRGLGRIEEILMGSVSQKVLHHAACTVVISQ